MATAPVQLDEIALIKEQIGQVKLDEGVRLRGVKPIAEWTGEPAWEITFAASTRIPLTKKRLAEFRRISREVEGRVFSLSREKIPFVRFVDGK